MTFVFPSFLGLVNIEPAPFPGRKRNDNVISARRISHVVIPSALVTEVSLQMMLREVHENLNLSVLDTGIHFDPVPVSVLVFNVSIHALVFPFRVGDPIQFENVLFFIAGKNFFIFSVRIFSRNGLE